MKKNSITGILIDTKNGIKVFELEQFNSPRQTLDNIYNTLKCTCIDVATRKFGAHYYDIYCDDEGLLKPAEEQVPTIFTFRNGEIVEQLVGNVFICKHDGEGGMESLSQKEISEILRVQVQYKHPKDNQMHTALGALL